MTASVEESNVVVARPRVFISYSWTSDAYQREVVRLACRLVSDGVDVVIDVWDLQPGHDKYAFMERCVADETIDKVLILCDRAYAGKANARAGGVGDETSVITAHVYGKARQEKFIPIVMERGEGGEAFLPAYLGSRMYIDLSDDAYEGQYKDLLRSIFGVPKWPKPQQGTPPSWLYAGQTVQAASRQANETQSASAALATTTLGTTEGTQAESLHAGTRSAGACDGVHHKNVGAAQKHTGLIGGLRMFDADAAGQHAGTPKAEPAHEADAEQGLEGLAGHDWAKKTDATQKHVREADKGQAMRTDATRGAAATPTKRLRDYSWAELKGIAKRVAAAASDFEGIDVAKSFGLVDSHGRLRGEVKSITLTDGTKAAVRIVGFRHDKLADGSGKRAGMTFEFADVPARREMNSARSNVGGWADSEMRTFLNSEFLYLLPEDLRFRLVRVRKRTNNRGFVETEDMSVVSETDDVLWLLSLSEVYGRLASQADNVPEHPAVYDAEGNQYQLYADQGVSTSNYGFCKKSGADSMWWLRSPGTYGREGFRVVGLGGAWYGDSAYYSRGVSPAFCL